MDQGIQKTYKINEVATLYLLSLLWFHFITFVSEQINCSFPKIKRETNGSEEYTRSLSFPPTFNLQFHLILSQIHLKKEIKGKNIFTSQNVVPKCKQYSDVRSKSGVNGEEKKTRENG